jgi:hypothetical protein
MLRCNGRPGSRGRPVPTDREGTGSFAVELVCGGGDSPGRPDYSQRKAVRPRLVVSRHVRADENKNQRQQASQCEQDLPVAGEKRALTAAGLPPSPALAMRLRRSSLPSPGRTCPPSRWPARSPQKSLCLRTRLGALTLLREAGQRALRGRQTLSRAGPHARRHPAHQAQHPPAAEHPNMPGDHAR